MSSSTRPPGSPLAQPNAQKAPSPSSTAYLPPGLSPALMNVAVPAGGAKATMVAPPAQPAPAKEAAPPRPAMATQMGAPSGVQAMLARLGAGAMSAGAAAATPARASIPAQGAAAAPAAQARASSQVPPPLPPVFRQARAMPPPPAAAPLSSPLADDGDEWTSPGRPGAALRATLAELKASLFSFRKQKPAPRPARAKAEVAVARIATGRVTPGRMASPGARAWQRLASRQPRHLARPAAKRRDLHKASRPGRAAYAPLTAGPLPAVLFVLSLVVLIASGVRASHQLRGQPEHVQARERGGIALMTLSRAPTVAAGRHRYQILGLGQDEESGRQIVWVRSITTNRVGGFAVGDQLFGGPARLESISPRRVILTYRDQPVDVALTP